MVNPEEDGVTHINIYSQGRTQLGRLLSNFDYSPIVHPKYGEFCSIEGLWYWLSVDSPRRDELRKVWGKEAKFLGRNLRGKDWVETPEFKEDILLGLEDKYQRGVLIKQLIKEIDLPFTHYYVYQGKVVEVKEGKWILDFWESKKRNIFDL